MFLRTIALSALGMGAVVANATDVIGVRLNVGYHWTSDFRLKDDSKKSMSGPEIGADFPLTKLPGIQLFASPSIVFGGQLLSGSDVDGQIYRFMLTARQNLSKEGLYGSVSAGVAHSMSRGGNEFRSASGFVGSAMIGSPLKFKILGITPNVEGRYYFSSEDQFRGFSIGLSANF